MYSKKLSLSEILEMFQLVHYVDNHLLKSKTHHWAIEYDHNGLELLLFKDKKLCMAGEYSWDNSRKLNILISFLRREAQLLREKTRRAA